MTRHCETVRQEFGAGRWPAEWVRDAVKKNWITAVEYREITGAVYRAPQDNTVHTAADYPQDRAGVGE